MSRFLSMLAALVALLAFANFAEAAVGICPQSNAVDMNDIGDGCSLPRGLATGLPALGAFKGAFTESCDWHDKCYTTLGTSYSQCDGNFLSDMRGACGNNYPVFLVPDVYNSCLITAAAYYAGVTYNSQTADPLPYYQRDALARSIAMEREIRLNHCATTVAATTLFDSGLVNRINSAWQTYAHRQPTLYEVFAVVDNGPNIVDYPGDWNTYLLQVAAAAAAYTPPVVNAPVRTANLTITASPVATNVQYLWSLNGAQSVGSTASFPRHEPVYNTTYTLTGFMTATAPQYAKAFPASDNDLLQIPPGARNVAVINASYTESGSCSANPKQPCR